MRLSVSLFIVTAWAVVPVAWPQTAASQPADAQQATIQASAAQRPVAQPRAVQPSRPASSRHSRARQTTDTARRSVMAHKSGGVLTLGATDITGNKELPKVMTIVPWKDSLGAGGVVKPTDSLLDEALEPVDRDVFQRGIHYYEQLDAAAKQPVAGRVAPVGDSH